MISQIDNINYFDGGAFAELPYAQYPLNLGRQPLPPNVVEAIRAGTASSTRTAAAAAAADVSGKALPASPSSALVVAATAAAPREGTSSAETADHVAATAARTRQALESTLAERATKTSEKDINFSGKNVIRHDTERQRAKAALALALPTVAVAGGTETGGVIRSPTKKKVTAFDLVAGQGSVKEAKGTSAAGGKKSDVSVPFCVSDWHNKNKLVVSVEQRLAHKHADEAPEVMGEPVIALATAMRQAARTVAEEMEVKNKAKAEQLEREQAAAEKAEMERAKQLLEENAARQLNANRRHETREERLQRVKLERDMYEREKQERKRQRLMERAAARLNISVEDLEADEQLLRTVESAEATVRLPDGSQTTAQGGSSSSAATADRPTSVYADEFEDERANKRYARGGVFASAVISNEGIRQEMEALAAQAAQDGSQQQGKNSIRLREEGEASSQDSDAVEDDSDAEDTKTMASLLKKRRHL